ncbi:hypothetical protein [Nonomuraea wenchangensis]|uniref:hypothetical protein n=1 Tax=Nonomuraea wenchangensis TaxID=568860 RepID=UPI0033253D83
MTVDFDKEFPLAFPQMGRGAMTRESALREMSAIRARHDDEGLFLYGRLPRRLKDAEAVGRIVVGIYPYAGRDPQPAFIAWLEEFQKVLLEWGLIDPRLETNPRRVCRRDTSARPAAARKVRQGKLAISRERPPWVME